MNETQQIDFLTGLGKRLDQYVTPGDENDYLVEGVPLWTETLKRYIPAPATVLELLCAHWIKIKDFSTQQPTAFLFNPAQRHYTKTQTRKNILAKAGRGGFTTLLSQRGLIKAATKLGHTSLLVSHDKDASQSYFVDVHFAFDHLGGKLGEELRKGALRTTGPGSKKNVNEIYFPVLNSRFFVETAGEKAPAEGETFQFLLCDEMARWTKGDPKQVVATLLSHMTGDALEAHMVSRPFGQIGEFYERYWKARRGQSDYKAHFFQWWWNPAQRTAPTLKPGEKFVPTAEEIQLAARYRTWRHAEAPANCGLPPKLDTAQLTWRRSQQDDLGDKFGQEFAEDEKECFIGSGNCPFDSVAMGKILTDGMPILERQAASGETENGLIIWKQPVAGDWYVLFLDPAGGLGTSRIAIQILHGPTGEQVAEWVGRTDAHTAAVIAADLGLRYKKTRMAFESNLGEISATVAATWAAAPYSFGATTWPRMFREQDRGGQWRYGWKTDGNNRPEMLDNLAKQVRHHPELIHSARFVSELKHCERSGDSIRPRKGQTDDLVMSMAGACKVLTISSAPEPEPVFESVWVDDCARGSDERMWTKI